ncbi:amidohydrolase family protein [Brachybacterium hainanense]|uniref:Amidohydrolase family protein n=1 Tax=Brachybacterium hainanense TaxID=1541174 RepID=A0ABV6R9C3_9MICO
MNVPHPQDDADLLITGAHVRGHGPADVEVRDGRIRRISPAAAEPAPAAVPVLDGHGQVLLPAFVDAHSHLDKSLLGMPWYDRVPGRDLRRMVSDERELRLREDWDYVRQISRNLEVMIAAGTTRTRAFADVDLDAGIAGVEAMLEVKDRYAHAVEIQVIAFPQSGIHAHPGTEALLEQALERGADVLGGIDPSMLERDPVRNLDLLFAMAQRHGAGIDVHLHEPGPLGAFSAELIIERTLRDGMSGRVTISHPDFLGGVDHGRARDLIGRMAEAGIGLTTNVPSGGPLPPLQEMLAAGLLVGSGCDGALDSWGPLNRSDMLLKGYQMAGRYGLGTDAQLDTVYDVIATGGAALMGIEDHRIRVGAEADLVLMPGEVPVEPIVSLPRQRTVLRRGRIIARDGLMLPPGAAEPSRR